MQYVRFAVPGAAAQTLADELEQLPSGVPSFRAASKLTAGQEQAALSSGVLAIELGLPSDEVELIRQAALGLHFAHEVKGRDGDNPETGARFVLQWRIFPNASNPNVNKAEQCGCGCSCACAGFDPAAK